MSLTGLPAEAALVGRLDDGNGNHCAYYDDILNITWLADASLAATQSFGVAGIGLGGFAGCMAVWFGPFRPVRCEQA